MGGRGRWMGDIMIERLWRSMKYECVYLREQKAESSLLGTLVWRFNFYNTRQPYSVFGGKKPLKIYENGPIQRKNPIWSWPRELRSS